MQQGAQPERSAADAQELMKQIVARMPTDKADVFAYPIAWAAYDGARAHADRPLSEQSMIMCSTTPGGFILPGLSCMIIVQVSAYLQGKRRSRCTRSILSCHVIVFRHADSVREHAAGIGPEGKKKMSQWVTKTIKELLGEEEQTLVRSAHRSSILA